MGLFLSWELTPENILKLVSKIFTTFLRNRVFANTLCVDHMWLFKLLVVPQTWKASHL